MVISDIVMAGATGLELVKWLRDRNHDVSILLISGYPHGSDKGVLGEIDVPFLSKPFQPAQLASRVREILDAKRK